MKFWSNTGDGEIGVSALALLKDINNFSIFIFCIDNILMIDSLQWDFIRETVCDEKHNYNKLFNVYSMLCFINFSILHFIQIIFFSFIVYIKSISTYHENSYLISLSLVMLMLITSTNSSYRYIHSIRFKRRAQKSILRVRLFIYSSILC